MHSCVKFFFRLSGARCVVNMQKIQSLPLVKSSYTCEQEIDSRSLLTKSSCVEKHSFRPFNNADSGASTQVNYQLTFRREIDGTRPTDGKLLLAHAS